MGGGVNVARASTYKVGAVSNEWSCGADVMDFSNIGTTGPVLTHRGGFVSSGPGFVDTTPHYGKGLALSPRPLSEIGT